MTDEGFQKCKKATGVTKELRRLEEPNPSYDEIRKAVQDGNYVVDFKRLSTIMAKRLGWDTTHH